MSETARERFWIIDTTDANFENDVIVRSQLGLVLVDFWAQWCGPCRTLGPILEKLTEEFQGEFTLVKANTDETPTAASQFGVSGIPAVLAVSDGQVIDGFQGLVPEDSIRSWMQHLLRRIGLKEVEQLLESSTDKAEEKLNKILAQGPDEAEALNLQADLYFRQGDFDRCRQIVENLERRGFLESRSQKLKAALELQSKSNSDIDAIRAAATAAPHDYTKQLTLAEALAGRQQYVDAFEICLSLIANDRKHTGEKARALMVEVFRALPEDSELTSEYRRKLSLALY